MNPDWLQPHLDRIGAELRVINGATVALQQEMTTLHPRLVGLLRAFLQPRIRGNANLDDIVQQTLNTCWAELGHFRGDNFLGWLFRIAERHCLDQHRAARRTEPLPTQETPARNGHCDQLEQLAHAERTELEWRIAERLTPLLNELELLQQVNPPPERKVGGQAKGERPRALLRDIELKIREYLDTIASPVRD